MRANGTPLVSGCSRFFQRYYHWSKVFFVHFFTEDALRNDFISLHKTIDNTFDHLEAVF